MNQAEHDHEMLVRIQAEQQSHRMMLEAIARKLGVSTVADINRRITLATEEPDHA